MLDLKILLWNLQDFFLFLDKYNGKDPIDNFTEPKWQLLTTSFKPNKDLLKIQLIRDQILKTQADILLFTEVGGKESLENFNKYFLSEEFNIYHFDSNSDRGIDLGILVKKGTPYSVKSKFHRHKDFARGLQELLITQENTQFKIFLTHLKSKLDLKKADFEGRTHRQKEVERIIHIVQNSINKGFENYIICGDLNGIISGEETEPELLPLINKLKTQDILEHLNRDSYRKCTYIYFDKKKDAIMMQLDYCLIPNHLKSGISNRSSTLDFNGESLINFPQSLQQKQQLPSDHYPIFINFKI